MDFSEPGFIHYSAKPLPPTPGSTTTPQDITFHVHENPFEALERLQESWRGKEHARPWSQLPELDLDGVDWHKYEPPKLASKTPNVTSQILLDIIESAVQNIKAKNAEEDQQKQAAEEGKRAAEEAQRRQADQAKEPYLPIVMVQDDGTMKDKGKGIERARSLQNGSNGTAFDGAVKRQDTVSVKSTNGGLLVLPTKGEKRRKFALKKLFTKLGELGESSATGAKRESLRKRLDALGGGNAESNDSPDGAEVECVSCLDDFAPKQCIRVTCHYYCKPCFVRLIEAAISNEAQWPPKCCLNNIDARLILKAVPKDLQNTYKQRAAEMEVAITDRVYCHEATCGEWIRPNRINGASRQGKCARNHVTCTLCRGAAHGNQECPQDNDMNLTNQLAEEEGWRRCLNCQALVEHREACQHMTCRCGTQFCYVCGLRWRTCGCSMDDLHRVKNGAEQRRADRLAREDAESSELRRILQEIEEYEREEALKEQMIREEIERQEAEVRQRELEERVLVESVRRRDVEVKFRSLREALDELHDVQLVLLDVEHEEEGAELSSEARTKKSELETQQESEQAVLNELASTKFDKREAELVKDYQVRAAEEKKVEDEYHQQLIDFWGNNPYATVKIEESMLPLRRRMDKGYKQWQAWKEQELGAYRIQLDDSRAVKEEYMYSAKHRMIDMYDTRELELQKRFVAEKKWLEVLIRERERLLGQKEVEEMEGDADSLFAPREEEGDMSGGESDFGDY